MKRILQLSLIIIILFSCQPLAQLEIETIKPSQIQFPGAFNKILFLNLDNDINDDGEIDTALYYLITKEMYFGFNDGLKATPSIDSSRFVYYNQLPNFSNYYRNDSINWDLFHELEKKYRTDVMIILDSIYFLMDSGNDANYYADPVEYYKYREISLIASWKVLDLYENKILDNYLYSDTLTWDAIDSDKEKLERNFSSIVNNVKEISYFAALDYSKRIFPIWKTEVRYYFVEGNKNFKEASRLVKENKWEDAIKIWKQYVKVNDKEIASRASYNLAIAYEILGDIDLAIEWAQISFDLKEKKRTKYYILKLKNRKSDFKKLKYQL